MNITLCAHCGKSDWHENMSLFRNEFVCAECLEVLTSENVVLGKCEYCEFPVKEGMPHYETADEKFLHRECYPKMAYFRMKDWREKNV